MGAGSGGAGRGRDPPHEHGPRRDQGRLRPRADACGLRRGNGAGDRLRRRGNARALPRGAGRWPGGRGAGGVALPLRHPHHRRDQALSRRARRPGAAVTPDELTYDARGLIPAVVQEAETMLERIERIVEERKSAPASGSYVAGLLAKGEAAVCRKIGEEAIEVVTAALGGEGDARVVSEVADLWFHTLVLLGERGIPLRDVLEELARRHRERAASRG